MTIAGALKQSRARELVLKRIRSGLYRPGQRLPSEREIAQDLSMSHTAVRKGLHELVHAGLIERRPRVGMFVPETRPMELSTRVAVVVPQYMGKGHPFVPLLMGGIMSALDHRDYSVSLLTYRAGTEFWNEAGEAMLARGIKGAIIFTSYIIPVEELRKLEQSGIKAVLLNCSVVCPRSHTSTISIDLTAAMREAMQRLVDLGHRRIRWMSYEITAFREFEEQLIAEFAQKYDLPDPANILCRLKGEAWEYGGWRTMLESPQRPTAMALQDEFMAHEVYRTCHQLGMSIPGDLSLVAFADALPRSYAVPLSAPDTVTSWTNAAQRAAEHVRYLMESGEDRTIEVTLHASIQWKESTSHPPALPELASPGA